MISDKEGQLIIDVKNLTKVYGDKTVVDNISLQVKQGDIYGFLGPNGSGKTTSIRMVCGLLPITKGEGTCLGYDIGTHASIIKQQVGYMTQKFTLYPDLTVRENLKIFARLHSLKNIKEAVEKTIDNLQIGKARANQKAYELSGGWKQRLALGVATIHDPKLLLLDEPTAGVDPKARREFWDYISTLSSKGITTLVSTHYMDEAERCNKLSYIAYGKLLSSGTQKDIINSCGIKTYNISGKNVYSLVLELQDNTEIEQVSMFGSSVHLSVKNNVDITHIQTEYNQFEWQSIETSLEDAFIYLMSSQKDNFA
ncbi:ABC transporter ATP-binding protein [Francisella philomiragia]|uniref:ABC transporter family protein n=1 Tax=Francisella philomiragia TaxID=28110 RepID=A0AAW3DE34_9GAMM|nr:ABC transporter ATP-binding protein [Francisella philomiragia]KFJ44046.1 ABC transporter family protein [Francisella philomiragia]MBK2255626.1 ABC transporter ATP-binding protein [Francisella philomiragia]MBK2273939.1 ABC transporter ATP-binding protein [Francisella philomiragia]MBK2277780.1 ABC transporter ATP-binding protein [Francisella philomiragia]MBK2281704.1 ABC transporter ATP-binding protein [Francisella philomiragia]